MNTVLQNTMMQLKIKLFNQYSIAIKCNVINKSNFDIKLIK